MLTAPIPAVSPSPPPFVALPVDDLDQHAGEPGALLVRVAQGDAQAFDDLYKQTSRRVYGIVRRIVCDAEMSAETTQDVFLALWQDGAARFDPALGTGMSWIMTLAYRRAVDKVRAEESHRTRDLRWGIKNRDVDYDQVADAVLHQLETDALRGSLSSLSGVQREAIHLAYYAGMTYAEVAAYLGIPLPTAKTRIRDGIRRLRNSLQDAA